MKKAFIIIIFLFLSSTIFSLEVIGTGYIRVYPNEPTTYEYEFFSVDLRDTVEIMYLGYVINFYHQTHPLSKSGFLLITEIYENNTGLSQAIKDKMRQFGANVCVSTAFRDYLVVNLLLPNGTYTTVIFEPS
jgi:hypothetical protein